MLHMFTSGFWRVLKHSPDASQVFASYVATIHIKTLVNILYNHRPKFFKEYLVLEGIANMLGSIGFITESVNCLTQKKLLRGFFFHNSFEKFPHVFPHWFTTLKQKTSLGFSQFLHKFTKKMFTPHRYEISEKLILLATGRIQKQF